MNFLSLSIAVLAGSFPISAQKILRDAPSPTPAPTVVRVAPRPTPTVAVPAIGLTSPAAVGGEPVDRVYHNGELGFEIAFPENWRIADDNFVEYARSNGFDLDLKAPSELSGVSRVRLDRALEHVTLLVTAYRVAGGANESAIMRVSTESLDGLPQVRDAVDYFDLMRGQFAAMKLPADFKYSETQAEKLGRKQFAFLDTSTAAGKKRLYATVKNGRAIMFALTYSTDDDLQIMRQILAAGDFNVK